MNFGKVPGILPASLLLSSYAWAATGHVTGEILLKFRESAENTARDSALLQVAAQRVKSIPAIGVEVVRVPAEQAPRALDRLRALDVVEFAEENARVNAFDTVPNDPYVPNEWGLAKLNLPRAWGFARGSSSTVVAIIDSGVDPTQPDLQGVLVAGTDLVNGD